MGEKIKIVILILFGLVLAAGCVFWSLGGGWKLPGKINISEIVPLSKKEILPVVSLSLDPQEKTAYQGESFPVDIVIKSEEEILAVDLSLSYNPQVLELESIKPGEFFPSPKEFSKEIKEGKVFYALGSLSSVSGQGILVSLTFQGKTGGKQGAVWLTEETLASVQGDKEVNIELSKEGQYSILELVK
jgi:hypothetical protein